jgi:hypothetical protein
MSIEVPPGFITVVQTSKKTAKGDSRVLLWDAIWKPSPQMDSSEIKENSLKIRSVSKLSKEDAVLRLKFKVCEHFGGKGWSSRKTPPTCEPSVNLNNKPWGNGTPETSRPGKRPRLDKPQPVIPPGDFKTTKHRLSERTETGQDFVYQWITTWREGPNPITGQLSRRPLKFESTSLKSAQHSVESCEKKVRSHFMPMEIKASAAAKAKLKKLQLLIDINEFVVKIPRGQVTLVFSPRLNKPAQVCAYRWYPVGEEALEHLRSAINDPLCQYLESNTVYGQARRDLDYLRRKVLKTFSGKFQKASWYDSMPQYDESDNPWGHPIAQWEDDIFPGVSSGEVEGFQVNGESRYGRFKNLGVVFEWKPARRFQLAVGQVMPEIYVGSDVDHRKSFETDSIREECLFAVKKWLDENVPEVGARPSLGEPPSFYVEQYIELMKTTITRLSDWGSPRVRPNFRRKRTQRLFVNSGSGVSTIITTD